MKIKHEAEMVTESARNADEAWSALGVPTVIAKALLEQGFREPTTIQTLALPPAILGRRDVLGAAETGSGKTLAFGIPILHGILELKRREGKLVSSASGKFRERSLDEPESSSDEADREQMSDRGSSGLREKLPDLRKRGIGLVKVIDNVSIEGFDDDTPKPTKPLYALILTPTRELAIQIKDHLTKAAKYTDIKIAVIVGGMAAVKQERILSHGPEIVIATPGRLWELIDEGNPHLSQINSIRFLVIDETDRMLEKGHFQELHSIIERVNSKDSSKRQTFVFSATLTLVHELPDYLQRKKIRNSRSKIYKLTPGQKLQKVIEMLQIKNPKVIDVTKGTGTADNLTECRIACTIDHKDYYLYYFLKRHTGRTLVFCNSIGCVKRLATLFGILNCEPLPLHASMPQRQRLKNLERFQANNNGLLIATDVAARGLDIPSIEHVIHYQVPRTSEAYVHRSGRTARAQKEGITVLMMEPSEKHHYSNLCKTLNRTEDLPTFPVIDRLLIAVKERVNIAREIDKLELTCRRDNTKKSWLQKAAKEMDLLLDDDEFDHPMEEMETADTKRQLKARRHQLEKLLKKPFFPKNFSGKYLDSSLQISLEQNSHKAIDIMKQAIEERPSLKKKVTTSVSKRKNIATRKGLRMVKKRREINL
ncbi:ATP-dependent RNA helicase DDX24 [Copidosoma floridanum]|uniref:ATP-dependent RNA helicase DDX24 n=1 Tax=Copidosoma floridanum TaxID=29053 RepID=UPI0006C995EB|nr:ATP-dependent RNA helicase DDX24 [Copidosoma floridanum]